MIVTKYFLFDKSIMLLMVTVIRLISTVNSLCTSILVSMTLQVANVDYVCLLTLLPIAVDILRRAVGGPRELHTVVHFYLSHNFSREPIHRSMSVISSLASVPSVV